MQGNRLANKSREHERINQEKTNGEDSSTATQMYLLHGECQCWVVVSLTIYF